MSLAPYEADEVWQAWTDAARECGDRAALGLPRRTAIDIADDVAHYGPMLAVSYCRPACDYPASMVRALRRAWGMDVPQWLDDEADKEAR